MDRKTLLKSPAYWTTKIQLALYDCAYKFMEEKLMNKSQLSEYLGVSKGYVTQLLNGDYNHRLSKLVELALSFGYIPQISFVKVDDYIQMQEFRTSFKSIKKTKNVYVGNCSTKINEPLSSWEQPTIKIEKEAA